MSVIFPNDYSNKDGCQQAHTKSGEIVDGEMGESRSQWPRSLRRRSAAARLLKLRVRIPARAWMFVYCDCCVLSGMGLCDELIARPEESYRMWCVVVCDLETSRMRRPCSTLGRSATHKKKWDTKRPIRSMKHKNSTPSLRWLTFGKIRLALRLH